MSETLAPLFSGYRSSPVVPLRAINLKKLLRLDVGEEGRGASRGTEGWAILGQGKRNPTKATKKTPNVWKIRKNELRPASSWIRPIIWSHHLFACYYEVIHDIDMDAIMFFASCALIQVNWLPQPHFLNTEWCHPRNAALGVQWCIWLSWNDLRECTNLEGMVEKFCLFKS